MKRKVSLRLLVSLRRKGATYEEIERVSFVTDDIESAWYYITANLRRIA